MNLLCQRDYIDRKIANIFRDENIIVTKHFLECVDAKLTPWLLQRFQWKKIPKDVCVSAWVRSVQIGEISSFESNIVAGRYQDVIRICWQSKSGRIWQLHDDPQLDDFECWITGLDESAFLRALYGPTSLPFKLKNLSYELSIGAIDMSMVAQVFPNNIGISELQEKIDLSTASINEQSEAKDRKWGVVHNWHFEQVGNTLRIDFDMGSAGFPWLKKWLLALSDLAVVEKLKLGRFPAEESN